MNAFRLQADLIDGAVILVARAMALAARCRRGRHPDGGPAPRDVGTAS